MSDLDIARGLAECWSELRREDGKGTCIESTRIGLEVLAQLGVKANPLPCGLWVGNIQAFECLAAGIHQKEWPDSAYSVGADPDRSDLAGYNGHLVIDHDDFIVDLDLGNCSRPEYGIITGPACFEKVSGRMPGPNYAFGADGDWRILNEHDTCIVILPRPELRRWKAGSAWRQDYGDYPLQVAQRVKDHLS